MGDSPMKGAPPSGSSAKYGAINDQIIELVEVAIVDRGEWYSIPLPEGGNTGGFASTTAGIIGRRFADVSTKKGRLWIRIKP